MNRDRLIYMLCAILVLCATIWFVLLMTETEESRIEPFVIEARAETLTPLSQVEPIVIETETAEEVESVTEETTEVETETEPIEIWTELGTFTISHFCNCHICCGKGGGKHTYTGTTPTRYRTIAVDPNVIPLGSTVFIEDYGYRIAEDIGGGVKHNWIDVFVGSDHEYAKQCGLKKKKVWLIETEE